MVRSTPRVFISATSGDLFSVRKTVRDALLSIGCLPVVQEHFPPDYRDVAGMLRAKVSECDALIHVAGIRYGTEPEPDSLPEGAPRRSYSQMELDMARELNLEKVFTFVCPEEFPYDTTDSKGEPLQQESEELRELQQAHRERLLTQKELRYHVESPRALEKQVREIQLELEQITGQARRGARRAAVIGGVLAATLAVVALGVGWLIDRQGEQEQTLLEVRATLEKDPDLFANRLKSFIQERAGTEIAKHEGDWEIIVKIEEARDRQVDEVEELIESLRAGLTETADPIFVRAASILADRDRGPEQALAYLQASRSRILDEVDRLFSEEAETREKKRDALRPILLEAEIHEKALQWDAALSDLQLVVEKAPQWWDARNQLGSLHEGLAQWTEADQHLRAALALAGDDRETAKSQDNLAELLRAQGRYGEAEQLYRKALKTKERLLGRDHPDTLETINLLALLFELQGRFEEAEPLLREALETREMVLGREHPDTLNSINNLALLYESQGRYEAAEMLYREALEAKERVLGPEHPDTLTTTNNLALLLNLQGRREESERLQREVLDTRERVLGREHPDTLNSMNSLALLLKLKGRSDEAEPLYNEALETSMRVLGGEHPDTLLLVSNLAALYRSQGRYKKAEKMYREALEMRERVLGREHPDTLNSMNGLAALLKSSRRYEEAEPLYLETLETRERVLGREHPSTLMSIHNLAVLRYSQGRYKEAEPLLREAREGMIKAVGADHPNTIIFQKSWDDVRAKLKEKRGEKDSPE